MVSLEAILPILDYRILENFCSRLLSFCCALLSLCKVYPNFSFGQRTLLYSLSYYKRLLNYFGSHQ